MTNTVYLPQEHDTKHHLPWRAEAAQYPHLFTLALAQALTKCDYNPRIEWGALMWLDDDGRYHAFERDVADENMLTHLSLIHI